LFSFETTNEKRWSRKGEVKRAGDGRGTGDGVKGTRWVTGAERICISRSRTLTSPGQFGKEREGRYSSTWGGTNQEEKNKKEGK